MPINNKAKLYKVVYLTLLIEHDRMKFNLGKSNQREVHYKSSLNNCFAHCKAICAKQNDHI